MTRIVDRLNGDLPLSTPAAAAATVAADATVLVSGFGSVGYPKAVPLALAESDRDLSLTVVSGGSVGKEIDGALVDAGAVERRFPFQARQTIRAAINEGHVAFQDRHVGGLGDDVQYGRLVDPDVALVEAVAVGDDWLVPSTSIGHTPAFVESADRIVVEVNHAQPLDLQRIHDVYRPGTPPGREPIPLSAADGRIGSPRIRFDPGKLEAVVETRRRDSPYSFREPTDTDEEIAENLVDFVCAEGDRNPVYVEEVHMQFGVGGLGNALMHSLSEKESVCDRELVYFGEVIQDGLLEMMDNGHLRTASATALALSDDGQEKLFADVGRYADDLVLRPTDVSNNAALVERFGIMAVNSALEVDVYGNVNSTHVGGTDIVNGIGGSNDYTRHAMVSVIALPSRASGGDISRVVPMVPHVDQTEHDTDVIITEHGVADLRGKSPVERAELVVESCAHPSFREDLRAYLRRAEGGGGHVPHDLDTAFEWRDRG